MKATREEVLGMASRKLKGQEPVTRDDIRDTLQRLAVAFDVEAELVEQLARELEATHLIRIPPHVQVVDDRDHTPWVKATAVNRDDFYWARYRELLAQDSGLGPTVISRLHEVTDEILDRLKNPTTDGEWSRRGMVVGHVQSGKTANYTGLVCKAADAGYKLIIVIAGIHNNLRAQTQQRIEEGFVGQKSVEQGSRERVGVGLADRNNTRFPVSLTSRSSDFNKDFASQLALSLDQVNEPVVLVIKKNVSTLAKLIEWLERHNTLGGSRVADHPMLLIDDEADNASINTAKDPLRASRTNVLIRQLLRLFNKNCYVGYTATPFANVFIDPETETESEGRDLFPDHFIIGLRAPDSYVGGEAVFGEDPPDELSHMLRFVTDHEDLLPLVHKKDHPFDELIPSMEKSLRTFLLARALRMLRGAHTAHCTMMVNVSRFVDVQGRVRATIDTWLTEVQRAVRFNANLPEAQALAHPVLRALHDDFLREFGHLEFGWSQVQAILNEAASPVHVVEVNQKNRDKLDYEAHREHGLAVIAVGGMSLSRGLTLEGLLVTYFLRNSKMYDTLMQMGRWFGYRPRYADLCRIWMTEESANWYAHVAEATRELHEEFAAMNDNRQTPRDFGLRVRRHPDALLIIARNKMRTSETMVRAISLGSSLIEAFRLNLDYAEENRQLLEATVKSLVSTYGEPTPSPDKNHLWSDIPAEAVVEFIRSFRMFTDSPTSDTRLIREYIEKIADHGRRQWDIVLVHSRKDSQPETIAGLLVGKQFRSGVRRTKSNPNIVDVTSRNRVASRGLEREGLSYEERVQIEQEAKKEGIKNVSDIKYRLRRSRPLLMLHVIDQEVAGESVGNGWLASWGASFPPSQRGPGGTGSWKVTDDGVEYEVNKIYWDQWRRAIAQEAILQAEEDELPEDLGDADH